MPTDILNQHIQHDMLALKALLLGLLAVPMLALPTTLKCHKCERMCTDRRSCYFSGCMLPDGVSV